MKRKISKRIGLLAMGSFYIPNNPTKSRPSSGGELTPQTWIEEVGTGFSFETL